MLIVSSSSAGGRVALTPPRGSPRSAATGRHERNVLREPILIGIVDDHPVVVGGIEAALSATPDIQVIARADSLAGAAEMLDRSDLAVILLDVRLPDGNGLELLARTARTRRAAVIVLSSFEANQYVTAAVRFGAQGFMLKTAPIEQLLRAIRRVAAGKTAFTPDQLRSSGFVALTPRERELVRLIVAAKSNGEIAIAFQTQRKTVETQLSRLYERIGVTSRVELAIRAEREGWLEMTPDPLTDPPGVSAE
jgi:DNA-binding NarL/FixJ family response regulator